MTIPEWFIVPDMSLPLIMRFSLTNEDLMTAYNAQLDSVCNPYMRYTLIILGYLGVFKPVVLFLYSFKFKLEFLDIILFIIGVILLRAWAIAPMIKRFKIKRENGTAKMIRITIDENAIIEESGDTPKDVHEWTEILRIVEMPKGFIVYIHDKPLIWLPTRVFENQGTREEFIHLAARKDKL
jgi:hypothetical protein